MNLLRPLLLIAIVVGSCFLSMTYGEHHTGKNSDAMSILYMHVVPAKLDFSGHGHGHDDHAHEAGADAAAHAEHATGVFGLPEALAPTNLQIFQIAAVLMILIAFSGVADHLRNGGGDKMTRILAGWVTWIRDEMIHPNLHGVDEKKFVPYFLYVFFFIVFQNLMGLVPGSATATASIWVTAAMALTTLLAMLGCGMAAQGPVAFTGLTMPLAYENIFAPLVPRPTTPDGIDALARRAREFLETVIAGLQTA